MSYMFTLSKAYMISGSEYQYHTHKHQLQLVDRGVSTHLELSTLVQVPEPDI